MNPGDVIANRFVIERLAGTGGMGAVYRARDRTSGAPVALKLLPAGHSRDAARFIREALTLSELNHPGIVRYVAHGVTAKDELYLAMEWLDGEDLLGRLTSTGMTIAECVRLGLRVAQALSVVHARGIVHRDIKPTNLILPDGDIDRVRLLDFGIARFGRSKRMTVTGALIGTPGYMAPEQARAEAVIDARADVFALGCVLFECLTGRPAFSAESLLPLLAKILLEEVPPISELCVGVPDELEDLIARMLSKDPEKRPKDGAAVVYELTHLINMPDRPSFVPPPPPSRAREELTRGEQKLLCAVLIGRAKAEGERKENELQVLAAAPRDNAARIQTLRDTVEQRGGHFVPLADGSMAALLSGGVFAADLAAQAARAALAMRAVVPDRPMALATGRGVVAARLPVGEALDRAGRLVMLAEGAKIAPNIALDEVTAGLLGAGFEVRGSDICLMLTRERDWAEGARTLLGKPTSFVGREKELSAVLSLFDACADSQEARCMLISAEPGGGKSRLGYEFIQKLRERIGPVPSAPLSVSADAVKSQRSALEIWTARGDPMSAGSAFGLLGQALRRACGIFDSEPVTIKQRKLAARVARHHASSDTSRIAQFLGELIGAPYPSETSVQLRTARRDAMVMGDQLRRAFEDFLEGECLAQPVVLLLDDLQWGDLPSLSFLDSALRNLQKKPLFVLGLSRPELYSLFPGLWAERHALNLRLPPLSAAAGTALSREVLGTSAKPKTIERLVAQANGNPLFLEELIRAAASGHTGGEGATVVAMVQARLEGLEGEARWILRASSIFGQVFWQRGVSALLGGSTRAARIGEWLEALVRRELIVKHPEARFPGETEYAFASSPLREAAYAMLTENDRKLGHRLVGAWLEQAGESNSMLLAEHYERGGDFQKAVQCYRRAAEQALDGNDLDRAMAAADRGVQRGAQGAELGALRFVQAEAHRWRAEYLQAVQRANEAMAVLERGSDLWCMAAVASAMANGLLGNYKGFVELAAELRSLWQYGPMKRPFAMAAARTAIFLIYANRIDLASAILDRDLAVLDMASRNDPAIMAQIHNAHAVRALFLGDPGTSLERLSAGLRSHEQAGDLRGACAQRVNVAYAYVEVGAYEEAEQVLRQALQDAERMGLAHIIPGAKQNLGLVLAYRGSLSEAHALETQAIAAFSAQGNKRMETAARTYLARILSLIGDKQHAEEEAARAVAASDRNTASRAQALAVIAEIQLARGRSHDALVSASEAMHIVEELGGIDAEEAKVRLAYAKAQHASGQDDEARNTILAAQERLMARAEKIRDPALRKSFLERVPEHARTLAFAKQWLGEP